MKRGGSFLAAIESALGVKITKELGRGYYGVAYLLDTKRVLKVSTDLTEASFGSWLMENQKGAKATDAARAAFPQIDRVATDSKHGLVFIVREDCAPIRNAKEWRGTNLTLDRRLQVLERIARRIEAYYSTRSAKKMADLATQIDELVDELCDYDERFCPVAEGLYTLSAVHGGYLTDVHSDNVGFRTATRRGWPKKGTALILDWGQNKNLTSRVKGKITLPNPCDLEQVEVLETQSV